ncbi:hypothetical protein [Marinobacter mobilis]|uniref:Uncharacterized protein n=1 Tax=Marinobacter mobilis TaxID=488533 RepID=A0A1H2PXF0_9GAMM|nr:hypothetical protein [Marinobacter mobilis]SDV99527.1 hypothetical protein SAMN04487960_1013 [Marinobacter mobilis]
MSDKKDWPKEVEALKAVQLAFDLSSDIQRAFRVAAAMQDLNTSAMVRKALNLPYRRKRIRPRITVTLHEEDFEQLAARYNLPADDRAAIRQRVAEELGQFATAFLADQDTPGK